MLLSTAAATAHLPRRAAVLRRTSARAARARAARCVISHPRDRASQQAAGQAILLSTRRAHESCITAALVTEDGETKKVITASLDKTITLYELHCVDDLDCELKEVVRLSPSGAPLFSLAAGPHNEGGRQQVFCGNAAKSIAIWDIPQDHMEEKLQLGGHSGWVRSLATEGRWLFSAGCSSLRQWDMTHATPKHKRDVQAEKGDILSIVAGQGRVYTAGGDGSIRSWTIERKTGSLENPTSCKAHTDRATGLALHKGLLYSVSFDGTICCYHGETLELVDKVTDAHEGARVNCVTAAPDGFLYTGGDDKLVRRWQLGSLAQGDALVLHQHAVRALASGKGKGAETLVSGDSSGEMAIWKV